MTDRLLEDTVKELSVVTALVGAAAAALHTVLGGMKIPDQLEAWFSLPVATLVHLLLYLVWIVFWVRFIHYFATLRAGDRPIGDMRRDRCDALRGNLESYRSDADSYAGLVKRFLDRIDCFFDGVPEDRADRTPLWTAASYDRCLILALIYPLICVYFVWGISGQTGPVEDVLRLRNISFSQRILSIIFSIVSGWLYYSIYYEKRLNYQPVLYILFLSFMVAIFFVGSGAVAGSVAVAVAGSGAIVGAVAVATAGGVAGTGAVAVAGASALAVALAVAGAVPVAVAVAGAGAGVSQWARDRAKKAQFYIVFSFLTIAVCALGAWMLPTFPGWRDAGPLLFFCGLLCMVNAPFNWASLGLTRFLLRRGLDKGGVWWPYAYALIDAVAGSMLITVLAVALTVAIDGFDTLAVQRGGEAARVLPPMRAYLADLRAHPGAYEYWWLHATILATLLPSVINLWIAGFVFLRGNILNQKILTLMPAGQAVPAPYSFVVAFVLTIQGALAVCFAFTAQAALVLLILQELMPLFRAGPLQAAKAFAF